MQTDFFKNGNPFLTFDAMKIMAEFGPAKMADEFVKAAGKFKLPAMDVDALLDSQRKNVEAITFANKAAAEGVQKVAKRQAEMVTEAFEEIAGAMTALGKAGSPQDVAAKQVELAKGAYEAALANIRELAELVSESNEEAAEAISARVVEALDEIKSATLKNKTAAAK